MATLSNLQPQLSPSYRNLVINGSMDVNQRFERIPITSPRQYLPVTINLGQSGPGFVADRWYFNGTNSNLVSGIVVCETVYDAPGADNVSLLLHMDDLSGSTAFIDSSTNNFQLTAFGNAQIDTVTKKFGNGSAYFDGNGDYILGPNNTALSFGTGDFTVECWVYPVTLGGLASKTIVGKHDHFIGANWVMQIVPGTGQIQFYVEPGNLVVQSSLSVPLNQWTHVAVTKNSGVYRIFINGVQSGVANNNDNIPSTLPLSIGADRTGYSVTAFNGFIDELKITKGVASYTSNFTPQNEPFADPVIINRDIPLTKSLKITVQRPKISITDDCYQLEHRIENNIAKNLKYDTSTPLSAALSFWTKSSVPGTYSFRLRTEPSTVRAYFTTYTINQPNTWEYKTIIIPPITTVLANSPRISLAFCFGAGTEQDARGNPRYQTTRLNEWVAINLSPITGGQTINTVVASTTQTNLISTLSATFFITGVQLELGNKATELEYHPYNVELEACRRYYQKPLLQWSSFRSNTVTIPFPVSMLATPTIDISTLASGTVTPTSNRAIINMGTSTSFTLSAINSDFAPNVTGL